MTPYQIRFRSNRKRPNSLMVISTVPFELWRENREVWAAERWSCMKSWKFPHWAPTGTGSRVFKNGHIHRRSPTQCLLTQNHETPSNGGVARNSESVPFEFLPEPIPEYPEVPRPIVGHLHSAYWHLDKNRDVWAFNGGDISYSEIVILVCCPRAFLAVFLVMPSPKNTLLWFVTADWEPLNLAKPLCYWYVPLSPRVFILFPSN